MIGEREEGSQKHVSLLSRRHDNSLCQLREGSERSGKLRGKMEEWKARKKLGMGWRSNNHWPITASALSDAPGA